MKVVALVALQLGDFVLCLELVHAYYALGHRLVPVGDLLKRFDDRQVLCHRYAPDRFLEAFGPFLLSEDQTRHGEAHRATHEEEACHVKVAPGDQDHGEYPQFVKHHALSPATEGCVAEDEGVAVDHPALLELKDGAKVDGLDASLGLFGLL